MFSDSEWQSINSLILLMNGTENLKRMRQYFLEAIPMLIPFDRACFYVFSKHDDGSIALVEPVSIRISADCITNYETLLNTSILGRRVLNMHRTIAYRSSELVPAVDMNSNFFLHSNKIAWYAGIVIADEENFLGELVLYRNTEQSDFTDKELKILDVLKDHLLLRLRRESQEKLPAVSIPRQEPSLISLGLTKRECEITDLIVQQHSIEEISRQLFISPYTAKKHLNHIFKKLNVKNRLQLITTVCALQKK